MEHWRVSVILLATNPPMTPARISSTTSPIVAKTSLLQQKGDFGFEPKEGCCSRTSGSAAKVAIVVGAALFEGSAIFAGVNSSI